MAAWIDHEDLRNQLWTNEAEAHGKAGVDDDGNGYVDDVHGWDFVDNSPDVAPKGACREPGQPRHADGEPGRRRAQQPRRHRGARAPTARGS